MSDRVGHGPITFRTSQEVQGLPLLCSSGIGLSPLRSDDVTFTVDELAEWEAAPERLSEAWLLEMRGRAERSGQDEDRVLSTEVDVELTVPTCHDTSSDRVAGLETISIGTELHHLRNPKGSVSHGLAAKVWPGLERGRPSALHQHSLNEKKYRGAS